MELEINTNEPSKKTWAQPKLYDPLEIKNTSNIPGNPGSDGSTAGVS
jgi:hypothetical protein